MSARSWIATGVVLLGTFFGTFNNSAANVALLDVLGDQRVGVGAGVWFVTAYVVGFAVFMPLAGRLADTMGSRRVYLVGLWGFTAATAAVAVSPGYAGIIAARSLQGIFNAPVLPAVMITILALVPSSSVGRAMGFWVAVNGAAIALGPVVAGFVTEAFGWRALFGLQVPILLLAIVATAALLPEVTPERQRRGGVDVGGAVLVTAGLSAPMVALSQVARGNVLVVLALCALGATLLVAFVRRAARRDDPFLEPRILVGRSFASLTGAAALQMVALYGLLFIVPLAMVHTFGYSVAAAGVVAFVLPVVTVAAAPAAGWLADTAGVRRVIALGGGALTVAAGLVLIGVQTGSVPAVLAGLVLAGVGVAAVQGQATTGAGLAVPPASRGAALGAYHTARFLAGAAGTTVVAIVFEALAGSGAPAEVSPEALRRAFVVVVGMVGVAAATLVATTRLVPLHLTKAATVDG